MWFVSLRDLQFRSRRVVIALVGTTVVFAVALLVAGIAQAFHDEARRTVRNEHADAWVVAAGSKGPFNAVTALPDGIVQTVAALPGVRQADPFVAVRQSAEDGDRTFPITIVGHRAGGLGTPSLADGRQVRAAGEIVVDRAAGLKVGETVVVGGQRLRVVGRTSKITAYANMPIAFLPIADAQAVAFGGRPVLTAVVTKGVPAHAPPGTSVRDDHEVVEDLFEPLAQPSKAIEAVERLMWVVAALIIGAVVYLTSIERTRDFAVLKAVGASSGALFRGLALQAVLIAVVAAGLAELLARALVPIFPLDVAIPARAAVVLPLVGVVVGVLAALAGLRRTTAIDPAYAFGAA